MNPETNVVPDAHVFKQGVVLKDHADASLFGGNELDTILDNLFPA
jgi:hypothetical protein